MQRLFNVGRDNRGAHNFDSSGIAKYCNVMYCVVKKVFMEISVKFFEVFARFCKVLLVLGLTGTCWDLFGCAWIHLDASGCVWTA